MEKLIIDEVVHAPNGEALVSYAAEQLEEPDVYCSGCGAMLIEFDEEAGVVIRHECRGPRPLFIIRRFGAMGHAKGNGTSA